MMQYLILLKCKKICKGEWFNKSTEGIRNTVPPRTNALQGATVTNKQLNVQNKTATVASGYKKYGSSYDSAVEKYAFYLFVCVIVKLIKYLKIK